MTTSPKFTHTPEKPEAAELLTMTFGDMAVTAKVAQGEKCARCWHVREDVGTVAGHETICGRCVENIETDGETRHFA